MAVPMPSIDVFERVSEVAQGNHGGFIYVSLLALFGMWLAVRLYGAQLRKLTTDLAECKIRHDAADKESERQRQDFEARYAELLSRAENLGRSVTAMWTYISLSADRRKPKLPPLHDMLDGKVTLEIREVDPPPAEIETERRHARTPQPTIGTSS